MKIRSIDNYLIDFEKVVYAIRHDLEGGVTVMFYLLGGFEIRLEGDAAERAWTTYRDIPVK
jgi:hypothetical protein